ncbi:MAG: FeoB-associated Cys-rich membrane protein [Bacilli bacterium]|nr:FeoB-associated Cys-rich membrane protein [Bacilli bacterium]
MDDLIPIIIIVLIIGAASFYLIKAKRRGQKCIGCPYAKTCSSKNSNVHSCCSKSSKTSECCCHKKD